MPKKQPSRGNGEVRDRWDGKGFDREEPDRPVSAFSLAEARKVAVSKLPGGVVPQGQKEWLASDYTVGRYLIAQKGNTTKAGKQIAASLPWRESRGLVDGAAYTLDHYHNSFIPIGVDRRK